MSDQIDHVIPDRSLLDWSPPQGDGGYPDGHCGYVDPKGADTSENYQTYLGATDFLSSLWIEPKDWKEYARAQHVSKIDGEAFRQRWTNQHPTHECTCHSLVQGIENAIMQQNSGDAEGRIALSPISVYAIANPRQWGGANCLRVLGLAQRHGVLPEPVWGQEDRFKTTLHGTCGRGNRDNSSGPWPVRGGRLERKYWNDAEETRQQFKPTEIVNPRSREEMACLVLHGRVVNVGRDGHAVPYNRLVWEPGQASERPTFQYADSYNVNRYDSWVRAAKAVSGSSCIWSVNY